MRVNDLYPSKWLAAADLDDADMVVTIDRIQIEELAEGKEKPVLYFNELSKGLVTNVTNMKTIAALYGDETDDWQGMQITLFPTYVAFEGKQVECIRVKPKKPKVAVKVAETKAPAVATGKANGKSAGKPAANPEPMPADGANESDIPF